MLCGYQSLYFQIHLFTSSNCLSPKLAEFLTSLRAGPTLVSLRPTPALAHPNPQQSSTLGLSKGRPRDRGEASRVWKERELAKRIFRTLTFALIEPQNIKLVLMVITNRKMVLPGGESPRGTWVNVKAQKY